MDPNAAWKELIELSQEVTDQADLDRETELARGLLAWLDNKGFPPTITGDAGHDRFIARMTCLGVIRTA